MKKLYLFVIKSYIGPLVLTFFIALFVLLMQFLWKYIDELVGKGLDWMVIAELMLYASAGLVPMALPLAILLASLMTFGNMGEYFELTAMKSAGISLQRIFSPLIVLTIAISIAAFFFANHVMPYTNLKMGALLFSVKQQRPELNIKEGVFYNGIDNYSIKIGKKNKKTNMLYDMMIYNHSKKLGNNEVILADSGMMYITNDNKYLVFTLYKGYSYFQDPESRKRNKDKTYPHRKESFSEQTLLFHLKGFDLERTDEGLLKNHYQMMNVSQLRKAEDSLINVINSRQERFYKNVITNNYFKKELYKNTTNDNLKASLQRVDTFIGSADTFNLAEYYNQLEINDKQRVIELAFNYARNTKSYISSSKKDFYNRNKRLNRHRIELHRKYSLSFACLVLFFIGAPLGAIIRKGGLGTPVVISVLFFLLYYIISISGEKFTREGILSAFWGMWISSMILLPLGIFLTYKATTDSVILNTDTYIQAIEKTITFWKKKKKKIKEKHSSNKQ